MSEPEATLAFRQKQRELRERCRHPSGHWQPVDWQAPLQTIPERIAAVARAYPDQPAAYDHQVCLSYGELDRAANRVANAILADRGAGQEVVGLLVGVDATAVTAALGVLRAGKIYVALEPSFPEKRNLEILDDAQVHLLLSDERHLLQARELAGTERRVIQIECLAARDPRPPGLQIPPDALALINYTSGSTSKPKGVVQSHHSAFVQAVRYASYYHLTAADRLAFGGSLAWAASFWVIFGPLCLGSTIAPFEFRELGMEQLVAWLLETEPTFVAGRSLLRQIATHFPHQQFPSVRATSMGGDTIYRQDLEAGMRNFPNALQTCGYGLSEAGRATQLAFDSPEMITWDTLPLGFPEPGIRIQIVSDEGQELEPGEVGEIVVSDRGLAVGYWRRPEETATRFRSGGTSDSAPAYYTGDLGRQAEDGLLYYMGRKDHMVKIRGYQVFTNEIESILHEVTGVTEVCVTAQAPSAGEQRLVAYLVIDPESFPGVPALHDQFVDLPRHMAPQSYVLLDALPKTMGSRKVDRSRLPVPKRSRLGVAAGYAPPRDPVEEVLTRIWSGVLEIADLGIHDSFLELGGDSLDSTRIVNQVTSLFQVQISMSAFFETLTIAEMAGLIREIRSNGSQQPGPAATAGGRH
jgi:amino acid adenylation domain-containing protein